MHRVPDWHNMSLLLSEVLENIGVSDELVEETRKSALLQENMMTVTLRLLERYLKFFTYGSTSEGTTTLGLNSDIDSLYCIENFCATEDLREWRSGVDKFLMIEEETTARGYCLLQVFGNDVPLPVTDILYRHFLKDRQGRVLLKNSVLGHAYQLLPNQPRNHGPAASIEAIDGYPERDFVLVFPCRTLHSSVRQWLSQPTQGTWPTDSLKRQIANTRCYVAPVGCRGSVNEEQEWRISTSEPERCLMFSLNITQIRVYILMKMLLKEKINVNVPEESKISSYMCKTVLFHCIAFTFSCEWDCHNLITSLTYCLHILRNCVLNEYCAHFIIQSNNLMLRRFTPAAKTQLMINMNLMLQDIFHNGIFTIKIDYLSDLLQAKIDCALPALLCSNRSVRQSNLFRTKLCSIVIKREQCINDLTEHISKLNCQMQLQKFTSYIQALGETCGQGNSLTCSAWTLLAQRLFTQVASLLASESIRTSGIISPEALQFFYLGIDTDVASSRLKIATLFYCIGDFDRTELILNDVETRYMFKRCSPVCICNASPSRHLPFQLGWARLQPFIDRRNENDIKDLFACCVKFLPSEVFPRELELEMFRSTQEDLAYRGCHDDWMDWAVIDSLPYLYFLQYKTYGYLRKHADQQRVLDNLMYAIVVEPMLHHRETALHLLGQCLEQENRYMDALKCYMMSLTVCQRNNAAKMHICRVLMLQARSRVD